MKSLAVLTGLLHNKRLTLRYHQDKRNNSVSKLCYLPSIKQTIISGKRHAFTARINAVNGGKLPLQTPNGLSQILSEYAGLIGLGLNSLTEVVPRGPEFRWWVVF